ncbi:hematopoietic SH2 domain-containing protein homolog [Periophthalmus magnuspinnatus]|uniref:hematopoietic SH2 domain-containing protein homolog n=1 Tax=Periophthalmus magnuspinnatus TaxID=409849 RepID=UPI002436C3CE|nr:hematopoietic SH2 domain-containing protein homolog [Periophthalmus magnuspinnatus]XP_055077284.1 hematopoietic SH2 domain-containing protein homolog [Periophthalmus magnuspinnatus]
MNRSMTQTNALTWFQMNQLEAVIQNGVVPKWFHGIISRNASEELLMCKPPGYFLIRVSESRIGYTLSYRAEDCCRHFMIDAVKDGYIILGDDRHHRHLEDLVDFHRKFPITPFNALLTMPCGQISDIKTDYAELLFPQNMTTSASVEDVPPVVPYKPDNLMDSAAPPSNAQPSSLYPSLDMFHSAMPPVDLALTFSSAQSSQPPELPSRNGNPVMSKTPCIRTRSRLPSHPKDHRNPTESLTSVVNNLKKFKKKLYRKNSSSDQAIYEEIQVNAEVKPEANPYEEIADRQIVQDEHVSYSCIAFGAALPQEYLAPPPFAPGHK